jgi:hypothetical protein
VKAAQDSGYRSYLVRMWWDANLTSWRVKLVNPHTGEERGFATLDDLFAFLTSDSGPLAEPAGAPPQLELEH